MSAPPPFLLIPAQPSSRYTGFPTSGGKVVLPALTATNLRPSTSSSSSASGEGNSTIPSSSSAQATAARPLNSNSSSAASSPRPHHKELSFKPPTHPHSHHLHTIPPREKTTHSLIVDQLLSQHSSVLLASTRAELAWGNITGVEQESRHSHEFFNGFVQEEDNEGDDGDDETMSSTGRRVPNTTLALTLFAKAQGLSNVICATLSGDSTTPIPHLPNLVRFRLALSILADQLLAPPLSIASSYSTEEQPQQPEIPLDIAPFVSLSSFRLSGTPQSHSTTSLPGIQSFFSSASSSGSTTPKTSVFSSFSAAGVSSGGSKPFFPTANVTSSPAASQSMNGRQKSNSLTLGKFTPSEVSSIIHIPPIYSSPRPIVRSKPSTEKNARPVPMPRAMAGPQWSPAVPTSPTSPKSATSSSSSSSNTVFNTAIPTTVSQSICSRHMRTTSQCSSPACHPIPRSVRSSIGAGLGTRAVSSLSLASATLSPTHPHLLTVLSNFLRISALIVLEEIEDSTDVVITRQWYALLAELLTRCVVEGYGRCGWRGTKAAEVLFGFGGGKAVVVEGKEDGEKGIYEPDDLPSLAKAYSILFSTSSSAASSKNHEEFTTELKRRKNLFLTPSASSSLTTHIQTMSSTTFPIEPLEKLMIRFVETADRWNVEDGFSGMEKYFCTSANVAALSGGKRARSASLTPPREAAEEERGLAMGRRYSSPPMRKSQKVAVPIAV